MHKKLGIILVAVALIGGLFAALGPVPAWAADPPSSFNPDEDGATESGGTAATNVMSDRFDGVNSTAHFTSVGASNTDTAHWFHCPVGADGGDGVISQSELTGCTQMGTDNTANTPTAGTTFVPADKAYGLEFNFTTALDNQTLDVLALTCLGSGIDVEGSGQNCTQTLEESITFDDAETGEPDTTSAEIFQYCTADLAPDSGSEPCDIGGLAQGDPARAPIDARFKEFEHGDPVPNTGFVFRVKTSPDLVAGDLQAHLDDGDGSATGADANDDPDSDTDSDTCVIIETFSTTKTWECTFTASDVDDNSEMALWVEDELGGTGTVPGTDGCDGAGDDCTLDSHYHAAVERAATTASKSLDPEHGGPPSAPEVNPEAGCEPGETPDKDYTTGPQAGVSPTDEQPDEEGCFYDQFNDLFSGVFTIESTGVGGITSGTSPTCTAFHDHNADGVNEHCHGTGGGPTNWTAFNPNDVPGDQTITWCFEGEPQTGATPPANHGCADETVKDSNVIHWATQAEEVFLAYDGTATDPNDPCRTAQTFKINRVRDTETLVVCTFDSNGNKKSTQPEGSSGGRLTWVIETTVGGELTGVRFVGLPPDETPDPNGETTLQIEAFRESSNFVCVTLRDANGDFVDEFCIEKRIERRGGGGGGGGRACDINGTRGNDRIRGTRRGETICAKRGNDRVRAKAGGDNVKGQKGRDRLRGGKGADILRGGKGRDVCLGGPGRDRFRGCERKTQ